jgi:hypothetical protein
LEATNRARRIITDRSTTIIASLSITHYFMRRSFSTLSLAFLALGAACGGGTDEPTGTGTNTQVNSCPSTGATGATKAMTVLGCGNVKPKRTTGEIFVRGNTAYTTTWQNPGSTGVFYIWDVAGDVPALVDSVSVENAKTLSDIVVTDDGGYLVVATESATPGSIVVYSLADPRKPQFVTRFTNAETNAGVHTAEVGRVGGKLYAFLSIDPSGSLAAKLVIVDLGNPAAPQQVYSRTIGTPFVHDTFVRDGILFLGLWNAGVAIWDIGGGGKGGTPASPVELGLLQTANGKVHNIWWLKDPVSGSARYAFIGEEGPSAIGAGSSGDIHVVDVSNMASPREVAFYTVPGAGTHNFSVDEPNGILYAAYYNGGVRALDVRGDLGTCTAAQKSSPANSAVSLCDLTKMGRELAVGLKDRSNSPYIWGVQFLNGSVYASDMNNGIWKLKAVSRP